VGETKPRPLRKLITRLRGATTQAAPHERVHELLSRWRKRGREWNTRPYYPAILDLAGRRAVVVGAGKVGEGKIEGLLNAGAHVSVVSLTATERVHGWASEGRIELHERAFAEEDLDGAFLVVAATEHNPTNVRVFEGAEARQMLCNVVDVTHLCNFILPSIVRRGDLAIAVSTGGASPAMARRIRLSLAECYGDEYAVAMQLLGSLREELKARYPSPQDRKILFERMVYSDLMDMVRAGDVEGIEAWVERCIEEGPQYASPDEHRAMLAAARPECKLRFQPLEIEALVDVAPPTIGSPA
jgi:precorrin-2 dehydrogenase/sirohydrochlorin ferrochelatase